MTWENYNWPSKSKFLMNNLALGQQAFNNRTNENIYKVYTHILGTHKLWCSIDKWGFMRGTSKLRWKNEQGEEIKVHAHSFSPSHNALLLLLIRHYD